MGREGEKEEGREPGSEGGRVREGGRNLPAAVRVHLFHCLVEVFLAEYQTQLIHQVGHLHTHTDADAHTRARTGRE